MKLESVQLAQFKWRSYSTKRPKLKSYSILPKQDDTNTWIDLLRDVHFNFDYRLVASSNFKRIYFYAT